MQLVNQWSMDRLRDQLTQHQNRLTTTVIQSGYNRNQHHPLESIANNFIINIFLTNFNKYVTGILMLIMSDSFNRHG